MLCLTAGEANSGELRPDLEGYLQTLSDDVQTSVIVHLDDQADIESLDKELNRVRATRQVRHERVIRALREVARRSQPALIDYLEGAKRRGHIAGFTPYWISNMIVVLASKSEIYRLLDRSDVDFIEPNFRYELIRPVTSGGGGPVTRGIGVTPGLQAINADRVWKELGITGAGRLVANLDTGVDGNHPALAERWRGTLPDVHWSEAWLDNVYGGSQFPVDYYSHGTHVMGTMTGLGEATGDTIGVAFGAYWIACNAIDQSTGNEFDNDVIEAFQWFADPDGDPGTVDDVPDVVQNSWGINSWFSGYEDCDPRWDVYIDNCEAAGVVVTFSAGNEGPGAQTHRSPANRADSEFKNFSVGAVDATNYGYPYPIADFSSRGPTDCIGSDYPIKPEVVAPGVDVYSSVPGGGYQQSGSSGTSMAGPHAAGIVALMREANPDLTVNEIKFRRLRVRTDGYGRYRLSGRDSDRRGHGRPDSRRSRDRRYDEGDDSRSRNRVLFLCTPGGLDLYHPDELLRVRNDATGDLRSGGRYDGARHPARSITLRVPNRHGHGYRERSPDLRGYRGGGRHPARSQDEQHAGCIQFQQRTERCRVHDPGDRTGVRLEQRGQADRRDDT
jgi:bacillopeptidase F